MHQITWSCVFLQIWILIMLWFSFFWTKLWLLMNFKFISIHRWQGIFFTNTLVPLFFSIMKFQSIKTFPIIKRKFLKANFPFYYAQNVFFEVFLISDTLGLPVIKLVGSWVQQLGEFFRRQRCRRRQSSTKLLIILIFTQDFEEGFG